MKLVIKRPSRFNAVRLELAPLIDVIFILLIFFAVSATIVVNQKGLQLLLPSATTVSSEKKGVVIAVDQKRRLYFNRQPITEDQLRRSIEKQLSQTPDFQVILRADRLTPYSMIIRILDEIRLGGCFDIVLEAKQKNG